MKLELVQDLDLRLDIQVAFNFYLANVKATKEPLLYHLSTFLFCTILNSQLSVSNSINAPIDFETRFCQLRIETGKRE